MKKRMQRKGQTAVELAVFGAILIFVLGVILRSAVNRNTQHHMMLRSTRMALSTSWKYSERKDNASRNTAQVLVVEDRLSVSSGKYGTVERVPLFGMGTGTHSANLFMPVDFGDDEDLPVTDLYVNGKHFAFRTAGFEKLVIAQKCANTAPCHPDCDGDCSSTSLKYRRGPDIPADPPAGGESPYWEKECVKRTDTIQCANLAPCPADCSGDCTATSPNSYETITVIGCAKLYKIFDNYPTVAGFCATQAACMAKDCSSTPEKGCDLGVDQRFDLDRNDLDFIAGDLTVGVLEREGFAWQWGMVLGYDENFKNKDDFSTLRLIEGVPQANLMKIEFIQGEGIIFPDDEEGTEPKNTVLDVDSDLKLEYLMKEANRTGDSGIVEELGFTDPQMGDLDLTFNDSDEDIGKLPYGFLQGGANMYTWVNATGSSGGGTYLRIDEGKLFSPGTTQFIRTASRKDQVDIIERVFRLSRDTGAFCKDGNPTAKANGIKPNPVEACSDCFSSGNLMKTCMDTSASQPLIYMRSRIHSEIGHMWVTDTSKDTYIDLKTR